jgi:hypothetical protein
MYESTYEDDGWMESACAYHVCMHMCGYSGDYRKYVDSGDCGDCLDCGDSETVEIAEIV